MEFYYSLDDLKELSPISTDTQENMIMKCKALQQEVDDLKTELCNQRDYSRLLQEDIKELQQELRHTNRELQEEKYLKWKEMNWAKEVRFPEDKKHVQFTMKIPMNERRGFRNEVHGFRQHPYRPFQQRWRRRHMNRDQRRDHCSESWRRWKERKKEPWGELEYNNKQNMYFCWKMFWWESKV